MLRRTSSPFVRSAVAFGLPGAHAYATKVGVATPLLNKTVGQLLTEQTAKYEHKDVLVVPHQRVRWTHVEMDRYVRAWGNGLVDARVRRKPAPAFPDRVLSYLPNDAENVVTTLGAAMAGRMVVSASPDAMAAPGQLHGALKGLDARMVVFPSKYNGHSNIKLMNALDEEIPTWPEHVPLNLRTYPTLKYVVNTGDQYHQGHVMWKQLMLYDPTPSLLPPPDTISPQEPVVGYTTTKGNNDNSNTSLFSHNAVVNSGAMFGSVLGLTPNDRMCVVTPLHTAHGLQAILAAVAHAAVVVVPSVSFDAEQVLGSLERDVCTMLHLSPRQLKALLDSPLLAKHDLSALHKVVLVGPAAAQESSDELSQLVERATRTLTSVKDVAVAYTAENVAGVFLAGSASQNASNPGGCRLLPHIEAKLVEGGKAVKAGATGTLYVRGFPVTKGHWGVEQAVVDADGWLNTGLKVSSSSDGLYTIAKP